MSKPTLSSIVADLTARVERLETEHDFMRKALNEDDEASWPKPEKYMAVGIFK